MSLFRLFKTPEKDMKPPSDDPPEAPESMGSLPPTETSAGANESESGIPSFRMQSTIQVPETRPSAFRSHRILRERDNRAARIQRWSQAEAFWEAWAREGTRTPFLRFRFSTEIDAMEALEGLSFIHRAADTGNIVCTETLTLGYYRREDGGFEIFLAGDALVSDLWSEARDRFQSLGGKVHNENRPLTDTFRPGDNPRKDPVTFVKEYREISTGRTETHRIYSTHSAAAARAFLNDPANIVAQSHFFIRVDTPDGTFVRDVSGIREPDGQSPLPVANPPEDNDTPVA